MTRVIGSAIAVALCLGAPLAAQVSGHLDLGMGGTSAPGFGMRSMWTLAPEMQLTLHNLRLESAGEFRDLGAQGRDYTATGSASYFVHLPASFLLDLNGTGAVRDIASFSAVSLWDGGARLHYRSAAGGGWFGLRAGRDRFGAVDGWDAGVWRDLGPISIQLRGRRMSGAEQVVGAPLSVGDSIVHVDTSSAQTRVRSATEFGGWLSFSRGRVELRSGAGWRVDHREPARSGALGDAPSSTNSGGVNAWWTAEGTVWLSDRLGLSGSLGRLAPNPALLVAPTNYLRVSVRLDLERHPTATRAPRSGPQGLRVERNGSWISLALAAPLVGRVEIMSDLTDWQPVDLAHGRDGRWNVRLAAAPGIHYLNVRYDGGEWRTPPSLLIVRDEFGKETGQLLIE